MTKRKRTVRAASKAAAAVSKRQVAPITEAVERVLKAVDVTRMLYEHKDAALIGRRNRDQGFAILLMHLDLAYKALFKLSHGKPATADDPVFAALDAFKKRNAEFEALCRTQDDPGSGTAAEKRAWTAALNRLQAATNKVCNTKPTTTAGVRALLEFVAKEHDDQLQSCASLDNENIEKALGRASAAVAEFPPA